MSGDLDQHEEITAALNALADDTDPEQVATVVRQYVNDDMITAAIARSAGGGGGSQTELHGADSDSNIGGSVTAGDAGNDGGSVFITAGDGGESGAGGGNVTIAAAAGDDGSGVVQILASDGTSGVSIQDGIVGIGDPNSATTIQGATILMDSLSVKLNVDPVTGVMGFYDAAGVARPTVPLTTPDVQDVIDALVALGLVSQSD